MNYPAASYGIADVMRNGKRYYKIFNTKTEAIGWESEIRKSPEESLMTPSESLKLIDWATKYLEYSEVKFADKTFAEKKAAFKRFFKCVEPVLTVDKIKPVQVLNYLRKQATERSGYAANKDRKNLLAAWNWGIKYLDLPSPNPCMTERFPEDRQNRYIPPESDFWKVYEVTEGQDRVMLLAYLHLAARKMELLRLRWEDIDFFNHRARIGTRKRQGGSLEYDMLPMTDELYNDMLHHRQSAKTVWVFPNPDTGEPYFQRQRHMMQSVKGQV